MQQKPKTTVKAKVKVKAKPAAKKPVTKATNKALRQEVIGKLKEKVVQTNAAPKMGMGSKGMPKMKSGCGSMKKYADGGTVQPPKRAAKANQIDKGVAMAKKNKNNRDSLLNVVKERMAQTKAAAVNKAIKDKRTADSLVNVASKRMAKEKAQGVAKAIKDKNTMPKMAKGKKMVKCEDGKAKVKAPSMAAKKASTATAMPAKRKAMTNEEEIRSTRGPQMERGSYYDNKDKNQFEGDVYQAQDKARDIKKAQQNQRDKALERAVSGKMKSGTKKVKC
jgi:hypothetical protein